MPQIFQNGMLLADGKAVVHTGGGGTASLPEECWVTVGPTQVKQKFINQCRGMDLDAVTSTCFVHGNPIATIDSVTNVSWGDASSDGGVKSDTVQGPMRFLSCSSSVFFEGSAVVRDGDDVISNNDNTEISQWIQPLTAVPAYLQETLSCPIEPLEDPKTINVHVLHSEAVACEDVNIERSVLCQHKETEHKHYRMLNKLPEVENKKLLHADYLREGRYGIQEIYPAQQSGVMRIPLGEAISVEKDDTTPCIQLLPLSFMRYDDIEKKLENVQPLYEETYLYIFKDSTLWRELKTDREGKLQEIELDRYAGSDTRIPFSYCRQGILLPIKDANGEHTFHIAVSHVQWSWAYIHLMGGLDREDPRFEPEHYLDIAKDETLSTKRLTPITQDDLIWDDELPYNRKDDARVNGGAVYVVDDPMGLYTNVTDKINIAYASEQHYLEENKEGYVTGQLVEQVLEAAKKEGKDYSKHVHHRRRKEHIESFELRQKEEAEKREGLTDVLMQCYDQVIAKELWGDFCAERDSPFSNEASTVSYLTWQENTHHALMLTQKGREFLTHRIGEGITTLEAALSIRNEFTKTSQFVNSIAKLTAIYVEHAPVLDKKLVYLKKQIEQFSDVDIDIKIKDVPLDVILETQTMEALAEIPDNAHIAHFRGGKLDGVSSKTHTRAMPKQSNLKISTIVVDEVPLTRVLQGEHITQTMIKAEEYEASLSLAKKINSSPRFQAFLLALTVVDTAFLLHDLDKQKASGEIHDGELTLMHAQIFRNIIIASEISTTYTRLRLTQPMYTALTKSLKLVSGVMNVSAIIVSMVIGTIYTVQYANKNEIGLSLGHALNSSAAIIMLRALWKFRAGLSGTIPLFLVSVGLEVTGQIIINAYYKNEIERWLFEGFWGRTEGDKLDFDRMITSFHYLVDCIAINACKSSADSLKPAPIWAQALAGDYVTFQHFDPPKSVVVECLLPYLKNADLEGVVQIKKQSGWHELPSENQKIAPCDILESQMSFSLFLDFSFFSEPVVIFRVSFKLSEIHGSQKVTIGEDAYELSFVTVKNNWQIRKVAYE